MQAFYGCSCCYRSRSSVECRWIANKVTTFNVFANASGQILYKCHLIAAANSWNWFKSCSRCTFSTHHQPTHCVKWWWIVSNGRSTMHSALASSGQVYSKSKSKYDEHWIQEMFGDKEMLTHICMPFAHTMLLYFGIWYTHTVLFIL